jgi:predicted secreted protein
MGITSAIVLFAVIWFMVFFVVLPLRMVSQGDAGDIVPGTHASAPANPQMRRKVKITTLWAIGLWVVIAGTIISGLITVRDLDWFDRMSTPQVSRDATDGTDG